ncbi:hypothetical protein D9M68_782350 [compost metagenome]
MQGDLVTDGHLVADQQRVAVRVERPGVGDVEDAAILHAGAFSDPDPVHIAANHRQWPHRAVLAQFHVAEHHGAGVDEYPFAEAGAVLLVFANRHDRNLSSCGERRL